MPETPLLREPLARALCFLASDGTRSWDECAAHHAAHYHSADAILAFLAAEPEVEEAVDKAVWVNFDSSTPLSATAALFGEPK